LYNSWDWIGFKTYPSMPASRQRSRSPFIAYEERVSGLPDCHRPPES
jgi:hypothetical protein